VDFSFTGYYPVGRKMYKTRQNFIFSNSHAYVTTFFLKKNCYTKFPLIPSDDLVARLQTEAPMQSLHRAIFLCFVKTPNKRWMSGSRANWEVVKKRKLVQPAVVCVKSRCAVWRLRTNQLPPSKPKHGSAMCLRNLSGSHVTEWNSMSQP
jgi:hypothetical protein